MLATFRAASIVFGAGAFCLHTGSGVFGRDYLSSAGQRYARLRDQPDADAIMRAVRRADARLPPGVENWQTFNDNQPVQTDSGQCNKHYGARSGNRFVSMPIGCTPTVRLTAKQPVRFTVYALDDSLNPVTADFTEGQLLTLRGLWAYLIVGETR